MAKPVDTEAMEAVLIREAVKWSKTMSQSFRKLGWRLEVDESVHQGLEMGPPGSRLFYYVTASFSRLPNATGSKRKANRRTSTN